MLWEIGLDRQKHGQITNQALRRTNDLPTIQMTIMLFGCSGASLNNRNYLTFAPFSPCLPSVPAGPAGPLKREKLNSKPSAADINKEPSTIKKYCIKMHHGNKIAYFLFFINTTLHFCSPSKTFSGTTYKHFIPLRLLWGLWLRCFAIVNALTFANGVT